MEKEIKRGDIYFADLVPVRGSEQGGIRPVIVVQNDVANVYSPTVTVVPATTKEKKTDMPTHVVLQNIPGLIDGTMAITEQIRTIDRSRLWDYIASVDPVQMKSINMALQRHIALSKKENNNNVNKNKEMEILLCPSCVQQFRNTGAHSVKRKDPLQRKTGKCDFCNVKPGYDYIIKHR